MEVVQMNKCKLCGKETGTFGESHCGRCDKSIGSAMEDLAVELGIEGTAV